MSVDSSCRSDSESLLQLTPQDPCPCFDFTDTDRPLRGHSLHRRLLETSSAPTQHQASCVRHVRSSSTAISSDFAKILFNPKLAMNADRNELPLSDAPFLSTTVAAKHLVELFPHLTCKIDRTHLLCHDQESRSPATFFPPRKRERALDLSTLRNGDTSFCTLHVPSTRVRRSVLHWVQRKIWHPRHQCLVTIHQVTFCHHT